MPGKKSEISCLVPLIVRSTLECGGSTPPWHRLGDYNHGSNLLASRLRRKAKAASSRRTPRCFAQVFSWGRGLGAEAQRFGLRNCFIFFVDSVPLRLGAR